MTINLDDYQEQLEELDPHVRATLAASFHEAARVMSPQGLHNWLEGAKGLSHLGRGNELVITYIQSMPAVAKEAGEEVIKDAIIAAMKLSSMVSGEVIQLVFDALPTAAHRLPSRTTPARTRIRWVNGARHRRPTFRTCTMATSTTAKSP